MACKQDKRLLRSFLEGFLDRGNINGLRWIDKDQGIFQVNWIHANNPNWQEEDARLFKEWAIHKGRYKQLSDGSWPEPDYTTWKANFRCAVNRSKEIEELRTGYEVRDKNIKTYKFYPKKAKRSFDCGSPFSAMETEVTNPEYVNLSPTEMARIHFPTNTDAYGAVQFTTDTIEQHLPEMVQALMETPPESMVIIPNLPTLQGIQDLDALLQLSNIDQNEKIFQLMDRSSEESMRIDPSLAMESCLNLPDSLSLLHFNTPPQNIDMCIWLRYREKPIGSFYISKDTGCRISNGYESNEAPPSQYVGSKWIATPRPDDHFTFQTDRSHVDSIQRIIEALGNGLHLYCTPTGDIYATRLTGCRIFYADPTQSALEPSSLLRKKAIKVFDSQTFSQRLVKWREGTGPRPNVTVLFSLGEQWSLTKPINKCHISVAVVHALSWFHFTNMKLAKGAEDLSLDMEMDHS